MALPAHTDIFQLYRLHLELPMTRPCTVCKSLTKKTCVGCSRTAYCSTKCQKQDWIPHILECENPGREVTTADRLVADVLGRCVAVDNSTMFDFYSFFISEMTKAETGAIASMYVELIRDLGV